MMKWPHSRSSLSPVPAFSLIVRLSIGRFRAGTGRAPLPSCSTCLGFPGSSRMSPTLSCSGRPPVGSSSTADPPTTA